MTDYRAVVGTGASELDQRLADELDTYNAAATPGIAPAEELTVRIEKEDEFLAGRQVGRGAMQRGSQ